MWFEDEPEQEQYTWLRLRELWPLLVADLWAFYGVRLRRGCGVTFRDLQDLILGLRAMPPTMVPVHGQHGVIAGFHVSSQSRLVNAVEPPQFVEVGKGSGQDQDY